MELDDTVQMLAARLAGDDDLADMLVKNPRATIEPRRQASARAALALDALQKIGGSIEGKLSVHRTIGEGGMGVVHLATQATLGRHVAVKTLRAGQGNLEATLRMLREAWVTGSLEHPNIVPIYDVGVDEHGAPIILMKRVEGRPWNDLMHEPEVLLRVTRSTDPLEANLHILIAVCNAIHFAHSRGILHRDIKPDNVMIGAFGEVYVLDWGIAVSLREDPSGRLPPASEAREIAGTPDYMAPEMLLGDPSALSPRTDVYLLGAVLYEIFSGLPPHDGANLQAKVASIVLSTPRFASGFPAEAKRICEKAMSREPAGRYESAEELSAAIEGYLRHRGSRKLARDARQSLNALLRTLADEPPGEERNLAVFNLLGECRFGYRAALSAWPENAAARRDLDRALLAVIEHELSGGDPSGAAVLLREVAAPPPDLAARVDGAVKKRAEEEERLRRLGQDHDLTVGTRTRTFLSAVFGVLWTGLPLLLWWLRSRGAEASHGVSILTSCAWLFLGSVLFLWARETMSKTLINRRFSLTVAVLMILQMVLGAGSWLLGITPEQGVTFHILLWSLTLAMLGIWVEGWFFACAAVCAAAFVAVCARQDWLFPAMSLCNAVLTAVIVFVWFPRQDIEALRKRRGELQQRAQRLFLAQPAAGAEGAGEDDA